MLTLIIIGTIAGSIIAFDRLYGRDINYETAIKGYNKYKSTIDSNSIKFNIPKNLLVALIAYESDFKPDAKSSKGCNGLMQVQNGTHNPVLNIVSGCSIFAKYREIIKARSPGQNPEYITLMTLTAYNMGPWHRRVKRGKPNRYANDILRISKKLKGML
jgi:soluble lytic murein transglycosylase-like protein